MKQMAVISKHSGSGQTTVLINLASGLTRKGYRVLIGALGHSEKLSRWLGIRQEQMIGQQNSTKETKINIESSALGIDLLYFPMKEGKSPEEPFCLPELPQQDYDYLLFHPSGAEDLNQIKHMIDAVIVCTDLGRDNELEELKALEECLQGLLGRVNNIDLILPNKIHTKEWEHNSRQLFALGDYFTYEKIGDPIPHCERIHDLPLEGRTVWELSQENLQDAFRRLIETVENLG